MNKAFTKESDGDDDDDDSASRAAGAAGRCTQLHDAGRVTTAARRTAATARRGAAKDGGGGVLGGQNGDRSENGDYLYGKKRLREIDRRIRFLTKRLDIAEVVDPRVHQAATRCSSAPP